MASALFSTSSTATRGETPYEFTVKDIDGKDIDLSKYKGKAILVVNVASQCGKYSKPSNSCKAVAYKTSLLSAGCKFGAQQIFTLISNAGCRLYSSIQGARGIV